jgi:integrase
MKELKATHERTLSEQQGSYKLALDAVAGMVSERLHDSAKLPKTDLRLSELVNDFFSPESIAMRGNAFATVRKDKDSLKFFIEIIGDKFISQLGQPDAVKFAKACPMHGRKHGQKRAVSTISGYMNSVGKFSGWVTALHSETGHAQLDFSKLRYKRTSRPSDEREAYTSEEVIKILKHPDMLRFKADEPVKYWLPHIAAYTGARLEEITQLCPSSDIYVEDDVWVIDINRKNGKFVKNNSAIRKVPIHSELIKLGLLEYIKNIKNANHTRLFPDEIVRDTRTGKNAGKRVNRFMQKTVGIEKKSLHSFRHTFATILMRAGIVQSLAAEILGQKHSGITYDRYAKGYLSSTLKTAIEAVVFK